MRVIINCEYGSDIKIKKQVNIDEMIEIKGRSAKKTLVAMNVEFKSRRWIVNI